MDLIDKMNVSSNYISDIIDEIALEGLDGISLDGLWKRLSARSNFCFKIDENSKKFIWKLCVRLKDLKFYELPKGRPPLKHYDYSSAQKDHQEANMELDLLYPYCSIKNDNNIFGSCQYYSTRKDISLDVTHMDLEKAVEVYSDRLVIVASQECRNLALFGNACQPNLDFSKCRVQYDILERIGRSRNLGVSTHGKGSLQSIVDDSKSIFHYLKFLIKHKIIKKQSLIGSLQSNPNGSKIYLMRFYGEYLNEYQMILQTAIEELKYRPNYRMPYEEFYQLFDPDKRSRVKKYSKSAPFRKYITKSKLLPYRAFFPSASQSEWERKSQGGERMIRCFELLDPSMDVNDVFEKDCESDEDDTASDFLTTETYYKGLPLLQQIYHHIKNSGPSGKTIRELSEVTGLSRSFIRSILRRLIHEKHCKWFEEISGRRHTKRYMVGENAKNIAAASEIFKILTDNDGNGAKNDATTSSINGQVECDKSHETEKKVDEVSLDAEKKVELKKLDEENVPYRTLRRIGMIIKTIKTHRYRLFFQIYKHILEEEMKEGLRATVCRMTVNRILQKLEKDGLIKVIDLTPKDIKAGPPVKLYTEPSFILGNDQVIVLNSFENKLSSKDHLGISIADLSSYTCFPDEKLTETLLHTHSSYRRLECSNDADDENTKLEKQFCIVLLENLAEMKKMLQNIKFKNDKLIAKEPKERELTFSAKFVRLSIIHDLMYYIAYGYTGITDKSQEELLLELSKTCEIDDELKKEIPKIYGTQLTSYIFVPPLKRGEDDVPGWFLISDFLLRLPLSIFVKILRVCETTPELLTYLNHPIRKHFLIKDLPKNIRQTILNRLQCFTAFSCDIRRLCFLGLLQYGVKCGKEQYQTLLYLNRNASLIDTTSSPPSYLHVPSDVEFPVKRYKFDSRADVKKYWQDMCHICLGTNLGVKTNMIGKEVVSVRELSKESLKKYAEAKNATKALIDDDGTLPGDHLGAGGIDSAMFSFFRSNWIGSIYQKKARDIIKPNIIKKIPFQKLKKELAKKQQRIHLQKSRLKKLLKKPDTSLPKPISPEQMPTTKRTRKIKEREMRFKKAKKTYYDEVDIEALKLKNTLRVTWSAAEDHLLLICHVAMLYLCPVPRGLVRIPWSEVRCSLQKSLVESRNKTQKAIARRIKYMLKNQTTKRSVALCLEELNQIPEVAERFGCTEIMKSIKPSTPNLTELQNILYEKFHLLINYIKERFSRGSSFSVEETEEDLLPDSLDDFRSLYETETKDANEGLNLKNIRESVIRAIIMSSLSCRSDKTSSAIQLFEIYRQYEDDELHRAIKRLNSDKVLTVRKVSNSSFKSGKYLPLSHSPCKLSFSFQILLNMKYSHNLYPNSYNVINQLRRCDNAEGFLVDLNECNVPLYVLASINLINFRTTIPEQIIVLDSGNSTDDAAYARMLKRYCEVLQFSNADSKFLCTSGQLITSFDPPSPSENSKRPAPSDEEDNKSIVKKLKLDSVEVPKKTQGQGKEGDTTGEGEKAKTRDITKGSILEKGGASASWRVILYLMREEAKKEINNFTGNRAQEFFVVNASQIHCSKLEELEFYANEMDPKVANAIVRNIVRGYSVPLSLVSEESVYKNKKDNINLETLEKVLEFIYQKREFGATNKDLRLNFNIEELPDIVTYLVDSKIVIKTGIYETRYVGQKYSTPWLLNSFRVTRLEREKIKPSELSAVELMTSASECGEDDSPSTSKKRKKGIISAGELKSDDYIPPTCSTEENNRVKMVIRPWLRIDGTLNRKVLDRFLGSILGYIMINPGITVKNVMRKFAPSFLPVWTKDLIEILYSIGCLNFKTFIIKTKASLFTKEEVIASDFFTGLDDDDSVVVEAKIDAVTTLGLFIGKRSYSKDFLVD